jgi:nucleotide-binding universal stress UspA family protein
MRRKERDAMKVLLAIDEEQASEEAITEVAGRSWDAGTIVRVLHAVGHFVPPAQELWYDAGGDLDEARQLIKTRAELEAGQAADRLHRRGLTVEVTVRDGEPGPAIVEEAREWGADLIVVGSRGHTGIRRMLEGSVSQYVVDHAPCPVEVIRAKDTKEKEDG